jgi:ubiquinone/menaquinone biosynthesis C-methylase UbiE/DNA-binding transcriptional ArsR family regulator
MRAMTYSNTELDTQNFGELAALLKAGGDVLRLEILRVLKRDSYGVLELCSIFDIRQSALSYQLKVLASAGLAVTRREGTSVFYRRSSATGEFGSVQAEIFKAADQLQLRAELLTEITGIQAERTEASKAFFAKNASRFHDYQDMIASHGDYGDSIVSLLTGLVPSASSVLEIGPGEGKLLPALARHFDRVIALDNSSEMLAQSERTALAAKAGNIDFVLGDTGVAIEQGICADCITINMVLHHTPSPADVLADIGKLLKPNGVLLVTDLCRHDQSWAKEACGDLWLGFDPEELTQWANHAGMTEGQSQYLALRNGFKVQLRQFVKPAHDQQLRAVS